MAVASAGPYAIVCISLHTDNHASTSSLGFYRPDALRAAQPTASKRWRHSKHRRQERTERQWVINVTITYRRWRELRPYSHRLLTTLMSLKLKSLKTQTHKRHETQTERSIVWFVNVHFWFFSRFITFLTFHVRHSRGEMYSGNDHLCVCWSVPRCIPTLLHEHGCNLREWQGCPLVVHYWVDMQSVHGFHCYDNIHICKLIALYSANVYSAEREMSASACTRSMAGLHREQLICLFSAAVNAAVMWWRTFVQVTGGTCDHMMEL